MFIYFSSAITKFNTRFKIACGQLSKLETRLKIACE